MVGVDFEAEFFDALGVEFETPDFAVGLLLEVGVWGFFAGRVAVEDCSGGCVGE